MKSHLLIYYIFFIFNLLTICPKNLNHLNLQLSFVNSTESFGIETENIFSSIKKEREHIFNTICSSVNDLNNSLDKIFLDLKIIRDEVLKFSNSNKNKNNHKVIVFHTQNINKINICQGEIAEIEEIIKTLKQSECDNLQMTNKKIVSLKTIPDKLVSTINKELEELGIKMNIVYMKSK
jgi:DNA repair ATPase RecN